MRLLHEYFASYYYVKAYSVIQIPDTRLTYWLCGQTPAGEL